MSSLDYFNVVSWDIMAKRAMLLKKRTLVQQKHYRLSKKNSKREDREKKQIEG